MPNEMKEEEEEEEEIKKKEGAGLVGDTTSQ